MLKMTQNENHKKTIAQWIKELPEASYGFLGNKSVTITFDKTEANQIIEALDNYTALKQKNARLVEVLGDIAYCKTWTLNNRPMDIVSIALEALAENKE